MKIALAGLSSLAALGAFAQVPGVNPPVYSFQPFVVTATRESQPTASLRDAVVITREELEASGALSLGEILERRAGVQVRATGGPGQPQGIFMRGAGTAQTLVIVDGLRVSSATVGTTSIENIPVEMIERIEVVKGPLSSLYGSDAIGGVIQIFTRGKTVPHFFGTAAYGTDNDGRVSAGIATQDGSSAFALSMGARKVDAPSATNVRNPCHDADDDPYENGFANLRVSQRMWQDELVTLEVFGSRGRTYFDGCGTNDRNDQTVAGARLTSANNFTPYWKSRFAIGSGLDRIVIHGGFPGRFETRQDQATWIHELTIPGGTFLGGAETVRQRIDNDETQGVFAKKKRDTNSLFAGINQTWENQRLETSIRGDDDESFGRRNTGSASYGIEYPGWGRIAATFGRGFRAPTFFDLYGPSSDFYRPNPNLNPEHSESWEVTLRGPARSPVRWRLTGFDNKIEDLITYVFPTVLNVKRARIKGIEGEAEASWLDVRWRGSFTAQKPRDDDTGLRLPGRAERFGTLEASKTYGPWSGAISLLAMGDRFDSTTEDPATKLPSYVLLDARVRYKFDKFWSVELAATNLADKRYETAVGYDAPRRAILLSVRFEAF